MNTSIPHQTPVKNTIKIPLISQWSFLTEFLQRKSARKNYSPLKTSSKPEFHDIPITNIHFMTYIYIYYIMIMKYLHHIIYLI